jgi:hypothetical protein
MAILRRRRAITRPMDVPGERPKSEEHDSMTAKHQIQLCFAVMRTTVTLDSDTEQIIRRRMGERKVSFKQALNDLVRDGGTPAGPSPAFRTTTRAMGPPTVNLDRALWIAARLEDDEIVRRMETGL